MDTVRTGKLIAEARKEKGLTQRELADQLHVSDRAVSKWERGINLPEASHFEPLCRILGFTVAELLRGERNVEALPALEQAAVEAVDMAGRREKGNRRYKRLIALLLILLLVAGYVIGRPVYNAWKLQRIYDKDSVRPQVFLEYISAGRKCVKLVLFPVGMYGPFERGEGEQEVIVDYPVEAARLPEESAHLHLHEITEPVRSVELYFSGEKSQMGVKIFRWPYDGKSGQSLETGEEVPIWNEPAKKGEARRFSIEKGYLYSVVLYWGDGYYVEYPFPVR